MQSLDMLTPRQSKAARVLLGFGQEELAKRAKLAKRTVMDFESGARQAGIGTRTAIAHALQLARPAPFFVDAGLPSLKAPASADLPPAQSGPWPREGLTVVRFSNSHLVYALTWFGLALMVVGAAVVVARYESRLRAAYRSHTTHEPQHIL